MHSRERAKETGRLAPHPRQRAAPPPSGYTGIFTSRADGYLLGQIDRGVVTLAHQLFDAVRLATGIIKQQLGIGFGLG